MTYVMYIVFVSREYIPSLRGGGIATYVKNMAEALAAGGHQITVIRASDDTRLSNEEVINNIRVISLPGGDFIIPAMEGHSLLKKFRGMYRFYSYRKRIRKTIDALENIDIIEVAEYGAESLYLQNSKTPVVCRLHCPSLLDFSDCTRANLTLSNWYYYYQGLVELFLLKKMHFVTSCSNALIDWTNKYAAFNPECKPVAIYNSVDIKKYNQFVLPGNNFINTNKKMIMLVGTVCETKGSGDLFESTKILIRNGMSFRLEIYGKISRYGWNLKKEEVCYDWLKIQEQIPHEQLMQKYKEATIVCIPSWWEAFGFVCTEAMMCGAIVIGSSSGGMSEIITDGEDGFLLKPRNPQKWAEKIKEIFALSQEEYLYISQNAQKKIREKFSIEVIMPQMVDYYQSVIEDYKNIK
jgi:glycosyltransferase involved in cell wall biosynthesis